jgi:hypothetical protein
MLGVRYLDSQVARRPSSDSPIHRWYTGVPIVQGPFDEADLDDLRQGG